MKLINYVLSSLSIMTALFLSLIIIIFDKFNNFNFKGEGDDEKIHKFHMWNFLFINFNAITSYAIFNIDISYYITGIYINVWERN